MITICVCKKFKQSPKLLKIKVEKYRIQFFLKQFCLNSNKNLATFRF